ncbi:IclR family transcriptional regulator [Dietzia sp. 179-F 9C3 NHS]|uniref:IclR family transcriptional regulator n=1 Tax=Dietzia sp. 179-F 9C3 NHS TaxID=3374295 RepID=UPI003879F18D
MSRSDNLVSVLDRVDSILDVVATDGPTTLTEIAHATGLPRTTVHRLLEQMVARRWLLRINKSYEIGVRPFQLGSVARQGHWFYRLARPHLEDLRRRTRLIVHFGFLDGTSSVWWDRVGDATLSEVPTVVGGRHPAYRTASGKVLLAAEDPGYVERHFDATFPRTTPNSLTTRDELAAVVEDVRNSGLAHDRGEFQATLGCVAAPITALTTTTSDGHHPTASLSVCGPLELFRREGPLASAVLTTSTAILKDVARHPVAELD